MSEDGGRLSFPPFPPDYRASGVLLHVASLPSPYGIGDVGPAALAWVDRLHEAGQSWWQALPLGPTGYGNSPYQSLSSFAGNELLISPDGLIEDGLLRASDCKGNAFSASTIDYGAVIPFKRRLLETAWSNFCGRKHPEIQAAYQQFCDTHRHWLQDYALFRALKARHNEAYYLEWPIELVRRVPAALARAREELASQIDQVWFAQFLLFRQSEHLKEYAHARDLRLIGDLPFFVSPDSSDVWANPELFLLDEQHRPRFVAGVPPDYFSAKGQLWGNPVYDWDAIRRIGYRWCVDRLRALLHFVDAVRLDHFRGFAAAWHVPAGASTAQSGRWVPGPGIEFFTAVRKELGGLPFIAEDLGRITPDVSVLRDQFRLPGTRVLQFAFDGHSDNPHLPDNYNSNTVVYTGTHDNPTTREWYDELPASQRQLLRHYLKRPEGRSSDAAPALIELAWCSRAALAIVPLQDVLNLGAEARMNMPGRIEGNWCWRCTEEMLTPAAFQWLHDLTNTTDRAVFEARGLPEQVASVTSNSDAARPGPAGTERLTERVHGSEGLASRNVSCASARPD
jgi:4-alpha-glucanotransferase